MQPLNQLTSPKVCTRPSRRTTLMRVVLETALMPMTFGPPRPIPRNVLTCTDAVDDALKGFGKQVIVFELTFVLFLPHPCNVCRANIGDRHTFTSRLASWSCSAACSRR